MPGNRKHHTDKFRSCVEQVIAKGNDESSAYAICTASLQGAGEPIYEDEDEEPRSAMCDTRNLHLLGATGEARVEQFDGRDHLVVPCVALQETVIHAVNAPCAEMVPLETLHKAADSFNNKPVVFGHPVKDGKQISANDPAVLAQHGMGTIRNSRVVGSRLLMDAYLDPIKVEKIAGPTILQRMKDGKDHFEISVGAFVHTEDVPGVHNGKGYKAIWRNTSGDHLAFLTGIGACSVAAGCGSHRMMERHLVTAEGMPTIGEELILRACTGSLPIEIETKFWELAFGKPEEEEVSEAIGARHSANDLSIVQSIHDYAISLGAKCESQWKYLENIRALSTDFSDLTDEQLRERVIEAVKALGGPGSGNFGHTGRPGSVGGSGSKNDSGGSNSEYELYKQDSSVASTKELLTTTPEHINKWGQEFEKWQESHKSSDFKNKPQEEETHKIETGSPAEHMNQWGKEFVEWQQTQEWNNARDGSKPGGRVNLNEYERARRSFKPNLTPQSTFPIRKQVQF